MAVTYFSASPQEEWSPISTVLRSNRLAFLAHFNNEFREHEISDSLYNK